HGCHIYMYAQDKGCAAALAIIDRLSDCPTEYWLCPACPRHLHAPFPRRRPECPWSNSISVSVIAATYYAARCVPSHWRRSSRAPRKSIAAISSPGTSGRSSDPSACSGPLLRKSLVALAWVIWSTLWRWRKSAANRVLLACHTARTPTC